MVLVTVAQIRNNFFSNIKLSVYLRYFKLFNKRPVIIGDLAAGTCMGVNIGASVSVRFVAQAGCTGISMESIVISAPAGVSVGNMFHLGGTQWARQFTWTPVVSQRGPNIICATATDVTCFASNMHCFTMLAGALTPTPDANTLSPRGALSNAFLTGTGGVITWSLDFDNPMLLATASRYIRFFSSAGNLLFRIDITASPGITFVNNKTLSFQTGNGFPSGNYYILMDAGIGIAGSMAGCQVTSAGITSSSFWTFSISPLSSGNSATTLATATMPTATGAAASSTASAILPIGQTQTTTLAPGVTTQSTTTVTTITISTSSTTNSSSSGGGGAATSTSSSVFSVANQTITTLTSNSFSTTLLIGSTKAQSNTTLTKCNQNAFIGLLAGVWGGFAVMHSFINFTFLFYITNR